LEEIERSQIRQSEGVVNSLQEKPLFRQMSASHGHLPDQPESPNTILRRTLNIAPPVPADTGQQSSPVGNHVTTFQPVKAVQPDSATNTGKSLDNNTAVLSGAAKAESVDRLCDDVASCSLITPQALLQTHFTAKVCFFAVSNQLEPSSRYLCIKQQLQFLVDPMQRHMALCSFLSHFKMVQYAVPLPQLELVFLINICC